MFHRRLVVFVTALALTAGLVVGAASTAGASGDSNDSASIFVPVNDPLAIELGANPLEVGADIYAVGGGWSNLGTQHFDLSAHVGPNGDFGHYSTRVYDPFGALIVRYRVDIDCVNVHGPGKRAVIKGEVRSVDPVPNALNVMPGQHVILGVDDESNPGDPLMLDDWFAPHTDTFPGDCKEIVYIAQVNNVNQGNININTG